MSKLSVIRFVFIIGSSVLSSSPSLLLSVVWPSFGSRFRFTPGCSIIFLTLLFCLS